MAQRNMSDDYNKQDKADKDMAIIVLSLKKSLNKYGEKSIDINKNDLIYKIIDKLAVNKAKATDYIRILQSRKIITIEQDIIHFEPKTDNEIEELAKKEIDGFFKSTEEKNVNTW